MLNRSICGMIATLVLGGAMLTTVAIPEASAEPLYLNSRNKNKHKVRRIPPRTAARNGDFDGDGVRNYRDRDDDNDGIPDSRDRYDYRRNPRTVYRPPVRSRVAGWRNDMDRDGIIDSRDRDRDGDGHTNSRDIYPNDRRRH